MKPIALIKKLLFSLPDSILKPFSGIIRKQLIGNRAFIKQYKELQLADDMTDEDLERHQFEMLKETLNDAYWHVPYYKKLFDRINFNPAKVERLEDIKVLPIMTKDTIRDHFDELCSDRIRDFYIGETGGSTGQPLKIALSRESIYREKAFIYHFWSKYGYDYKKSRIATFRGVEFSDRISRINPLYNELLLNPFLLSEKNVDMYIDWINKFEVEFIHGYPSAIANFCRILNIQGKTLKKKIKSVFLISEQCSKEQKEIIEKTLKCKVYIFYGHTERASFAEQIDYNGDFIYEFNKMYSYTEIEGNVDENIVCTGFINRKMPLIRYLVDDEAVECEKGKYVINGHRKSDVIYGVNGERFSQAALNFHDGTFSRIQAYQLFQKEYGKVQCKVIAEKPLSAEEISDIVIALYRKCGNSIEWEVKQVEQLELTNKGKCKTVIQMVTV